MKYDYIRLYEKNAAFFNAHKHAKSFLYGVNAFLTACFPLAYSCAWGYEIFFGKANAKLLLWLFVLPAFALLAVSVLRLAISRPRPYCKDGANITPVIETPSRDTSSFPSRHTASAAVIATTLLRFFPLLGGFLLIATLALAYARFALGWHYPSDLLTGLGLGGSIGACIFLI